MDQKKIGRLLKELRREKNITQETFAEILQVSGRTVSRWETGSNMPDIFSQGACRRIRSRSAKRIENR